MSNRAQSKAAHRPPVRVGRPEISVGGESSIVVLDRFIQATRDSGYKGTASAISELVDNSIQAGATRISISMGASAADGSISVRTSDNGCGMDPPTLRQSLRFGGSTRFGYRTGLGRYGMGLPNSSLSQARRLGVYTWQGAGSGRNPSARDVRVYRSYLDVDEIVAGEMKEVPEPALAEGAEVPVTTRSGTVVIWESCDRLDYRRISTLVRKLHTELARRFRHFLWKGLRIDINGEKVTSYDPLLVHQNAQVSGARRFGGRLFFEVCANPANPTVTGRVEVRFSELPVESWYCLSNEEKRGRA